MGRLHELVYLNDSDRIAIAICHSGNHVGLFYRDESSPARVLLFHLCSHRKLRNDPPRLRDKCSLWVVPSVEPEHANSVIAHTVNISNKQGNGRMPYGFSDPRGFFDSEGNILFDAGQLGLTCATILLSVFDMSGAPLLRYDTWQARPDDADKQRALIRSMRPDYPDDAAHFDKLEAMEVGTIRFRPLEVAGGALSDDMPIDFETAKLVAAELQARLNAHA